MSVSKGSKRAGGSARRAASEDYDEYMTGVPAAAPAITGALDRAEERERAERERAEREVAERERAERGEEGVVEGPGAEAREVAPRAKEPRSARGKKLAELGLPKYRAGGRPPAADLVGVAPVRQSVTLSPSQVKRLQKEVQRRKRGGLVTDLSALCRELLVAFRATGSTVALTRGSGGVRLVQQTIYLTQEQVEWLVGEVLRRHGVGEHADKSSLLRAAIDHGLSSKKIDSE